MKPETDESKIRELLSRGVEEAIVAKDLEGKLRSGKPLRIKFGIDPTSPNIHIGRAVPLLKLKDFQDLGHQIVLIIGNFTGTIGDTSDKDSERPMLEQKVVTENMRNYTEQAGKILDLARCEVVYNADWLVKLGFAEIGALADNFSVSDFISRELIKNRLEAGKRVSLRELLYPLMQGYDSVAVRSDVEIGGSDQRFNILAGRTIQAAYGLEPQNIVVGPLIEGTDGRKMSSSWGNTINLTAEPGDMYGKVMSIRDDLIIKYFTLTTRIPLAQIAEYDAAITSGSNPKDYKMKLAKELVRMYHGAEEAERAEQSFENSFRKGGLPGDVLTVRVAAGATLVDTLVGAGYVKSKSDFRRLVEEGAITEVESKEKVTDPLLVITRPAAYRIGKSRFLKIEV